MSCFNIPNEYTSVPFLYGNINRIWETYRFHGGSNSVTDRLILINITYRLEAANGKTVFFPKAQKVQSHISNYRTKFRLLPVAYWKGSLVKLKNKKHMLLFHWIWTHDICNDIFVGISIIYSPDNKRFFCIAIVLHLLILWVIIVRMYAIKLS